MASPPEHAPSARGRANAPGVSRYMTKRILIDASHAEETRVVVLDGNRLEDFDVETANRKQIKGNIYLAKVIRVEPSLQAAFVEYGGNRHGFLAFGEIHPDYYQIPVADRQRLLAQQAADEEEEVRAAEEQADAIVPEPDFSEVSLESNAGDDEPSKPSTDTQPLEIKPISITRAAPPEISSDPFIVNADGEANTELGAGPIIEPGADERGAEPNDEHVTAPTEASQSDTEYEARQEIDPEDAGSGEQPEAPPPESFGGDGDDAAEERERRQRQRFLRNYKIQEVIHRRQIMLIQVVKEERGNKGAALTTYLSLAGRFSVLMPNSPSGGGVSRKITSVADRRRLKEAMAELDVPDGMGLIVRTAGANRPKPEIKRDCEYLLRLWDDIRERTLTSSAPALIYEEASLIKRTIRDVYTRDVEDVVVDGEEGYRAARDFMRMLMPTNVRKVQLWTEGQPLFARHQVEAQLDAMLNPIVQLRSGGYIVINQTEALVAIDVNSGRSTRERNIEDTALRTNMEAAEEAARQLRMRDLAGLIVIDFIDMESRKNNASVERRLKDSLKNDRARIQVGTISHFGLMEMSRQRLRPSLAEASLVTCPHCAGMGHVRSPESAALHILRAIEDEGAKLRSAEIAVFLPPDVALYLFNHKRDRLAAIEVRYAMRVVFNGDSSLTAANFRIEKLRAQTAPIPAPVTPTRAPIVDDAASSDSSDGDDENDSDAEDEAKAPANESAEEGERRQRRRRRRGKRRPEPGQGDAASDQSDTATRAENPPTHEDANDQPSEIDLVIAAELGDQPEPGTETAEDPARRRRSRGGRRRRPAAGEDASQPADPAPTPVYVPEPFFADVADIFEAAERAEAEALRVRVEARLSAAPALPPAAPATLHVEGHFEPVAETSSDHDHSFGAPANEEAKADTESLDLQQAAAEPLVKPILVDTQAPALEKKRGWWRR
jgi:ribonuclease E